MKKIISAIVSGSLAFLLVDSVVAMEEKEEGPIEVSNVKNFPYCNQFDRISLVNNLRFLKRTLYLSENYQDLKKRGWEKIDSQEEIDEWGGASNCKYVLPEGSVLDRAAVYLPTNRAWINNRDGESWLGFDSEKDWKKISTNNWGKNLSAEGVRTIFDGPNQDGFIICIQNRRLGNTEYNFLRITIACWSNGLSTKVKMQEPDLEFATACAISQSGALYAVAQKNNNNKEGQKNSICLYFPEYNKISGLCGEWRLCQKYKLFTNREYKKLCFISRNKLLALDSSGVIDDITLNTENAEIKEKGGRPRRCSYPGLSSNWQVIFKDFSIKNVLGPDFVHDFAVNMFLPLYIVYLVKENKEADKQKLILEKRAPEDSGQKPKRWTLLDNLKHVTRIWSCEDRVGYMTEEPITRDPKGEEDEEEKKVAKQKMAMNIFTVPSLTTLVKEKKERIEQEKEKKRQEEEREKQRQAEEKKKRDEEDRKLEEKFENEKRGKMILYTASGVALLGTCAIAYKVLQNNTGAETIVKASTSGVAQAAKNKTLWQKAGSFIGSLFSEIGLW